MDKKPFDRSQGQGTGQAEHPAKPEPDHKMPDAVEKDKASRRPGEQPVSQPIDKRMPSPWAGAGPKDLTEGERSDRQSGRPVQLEEHDEGKGKRRDAELGGRRPDDRKANEGQTTKR